MIPVLKKFTIGSKDVCKQTYKIIKDQCCQKCKNKVLGDDGKEKCIMSEGKDT